MSVGEWLLVLTFAGPAIVAAVYAIAMIYGVIHLAVQALIERHQDRQLRRRG